MPRPRASCQYAVSLISSSPPSGHCNGNTRTREHPRNTKARVSPFLDGPQLIDAVEAIALVQNHHRENSSLERLTKLCMYYEEGAMKLLLKVCIRTRPAKFSRRLSFPVPPPAQKIGARAKVDDERWFFDGCCVTLAGGRIGGGRKCQGCPQSSGRQTEPAARQVPTLQIAITKLQTKMQSSSDDHDHGHGDW